MYILNEKNNTYQFEGNLEAYLTEKGVSKQHIENMKSKIMSEGKGYYHNYVGRDSGEYKYLTLVPLDKVIGTSRSTVGSSVFENILNVNEKKREPSKFSRCFGYLENMTLEEFKESFETKIEPVDMEYYVEDDEYYVSHDGNHRTLVALLVGAERIKARVTNAYCDKDKKKQYFCYRRFIKDYGVERFLKGISKTGTYDIVFRDGKSKYIVCGYGKRNPQEDVEKYYSDLSKTIKREQEIARILNRIPVLANGLIRIGVNNRITQHYERVNCDCSRNRILNKVSWREI